MKAHIEYDDFGEFIEILDDDDFQTANCQQRKEDKHTVITFFLQK